MTFLQRPTRNLFFTGKGGVGKTSLACATAVTLADRGRKVLLVSTDPASNLDEVLGVLLTGKPLPVPQAPGLYAMNLDPQEAAREYRERVVGPYRGLLPQAALAGMEEQLSGGCTLEIAAFDEFARLLADPRAAGKFDHVVFDTAPTGHTLRLLSLPSAWTGFLETNTTGTSCLGQLAGLQAQQELYRSTVGALADPAVTTLVLVSRPEPAALREADRTRQELAALGVTNQHLALNGLFTASVPDDSVAVAFQKRGSDALRSMPADLAALPRTVVPLTSGGLLGVEAVRALIRPAHPGSHAPVVPAAPVAVPPPLASLVEELARPGRGVILTMGKGGVGKTTVAAAVAVELARRGYRVRLTTTDPAAHVEAAVAGSLPNLTVSRIDPHAETRGYTEEVMANAGAGLDEQGRALLEEDLRSPCTEEIAVFRAFARAVAEGQDGFVVLDTAPTGHTILLLDAALAYHREVSRQSSELPESVRLLLPRLRDRDYTRVLVVTLPEATPVHEAAALRQDLRRAGIEPFAWVINQSLVPLTVRDPVLRARQRQEGQYIGEVQDRLADRVVLVPWQRMPPVGVEGLRALLEDAHGNGPGPVRIQVLGLGCPKCDRLADRAEQAARRLGLGYDLEKVRDLVRIVEVGAAVPALLVDGVVRSAGRVPSLAEIERYLSGSAS
jgi:arsenite-transporting ATPase